MREMMQKALSALSSSKNSRVADKNQKAVSTQSQTSKEDWGMSPEDALKTSMVSGYK